MRSITVLALACLVSFAAARPEKSHVKYATKEFLEKQEDIFALFRHIYQPDYNQQLVAIAKGIKISERTEYFTNKTVVAQFVELYEHGFLPKGEIFSIYEEEHRRQAVALFELLYFTKDFDSFYRTAAWARYYINEGIFVYATTAALLHHDDFEGYILPPLYEIYPYYFINSEVITKAQKIKMQNFHGLKKIDDIYTVVIPHNTTGRQIYTNPEQRLSYFTEDIGLNAFYYYFHIDYPFWMGGKEYGLLDDRRGELYLYQHQQILARYFMERLSNNLGDIPEFSWTKPIRTGYHPILSYYNGNAFPSRENSHLFNKEDHYYDIELIQEYEHRIREAIDLGYITLPNGTFIDITTPESIEIIGNIIQSNEDSPNTRYYKYVALIAKYILGTSVEPTKHNQVIPSVLEHFETSMRDPVFYQIYKRIVRYYFQFKDQLTPYTREELDFQGIKIKDVEVSKLVTYFDQYDVDITNAIDIEPETYVEGKYTKDTKVDYKPEPVLIKARTTRLNHMPFNYKLTVNSDKATKSSIHTYIGPKYNNYKQFESLNVNRENFFELDHFIYELVPGVNVITRNSVDFHEFVYDRTTYYEIYKKIMASIKGDDKFPIDQSEAHCGFPDRLMLPKGMKQGMEFQLFFIVSEYKAPITQLHKGYDPVISCGIGSGARYIDSYPLGYPFDRKIDEVAFNTNNMHFEDVTIFHKKETEVNTVGGI